MLVLYAIAILFVGTRYMFFVLFSLNFKFNVVIHYIRAIFNNSETYLILTHCILHSCRKSIWLTESY